LSKRLSGDKQESKHSDRCDEAMNVGRHQMADFLHSDMKVPKSARNSNEGSRQFHTLRILQATEPTRLIFGHLQAMLSVKVERSSNDTRPAPPTASGRSFDTSAAVQ
jgi:hypothetical protein